MGKIKNPSWRILERCGEGFCFGVLGVLGWERLLDGDFPGAVGGAKGEAVASEVVGEVEPDGAVEVVGDEDGVARAGDEGGKVVADGFAEDVEHGIDAHGVDDLDVAGTEGRNIALFVVFWVGFLASGKVNKTFGGAVGEVGPG